MNEWNTHNYIKLCFIQINIIPIFNLLGFKTFYSSKLINSLYYNFYFPYCFLKMYVTVTTKNVWKR